MEKNSFTNILILLGGLSFGVGVVWKLFNLSIMFEPLVLWRFSIGCLALATALLLQRIAQR